MQEKHTIFVRHFQFDLKFVAKARKFKGIYHVDFGYFLSGISHKRFVSQFIDQNKFVVWLCTIQLQLSVNDRWKALCLNRINFNVCHGSWSGPIVPKWCIATSMFKCFFIAFNSTGLIEATHLSNCWINCIQLGHNVNQYCLNTFE